MSGASDRAAVTYLDRILAAHRARAQADHRPIAELVAAARDAAPARGFTRALRSAASRELAVIAEVKRRSPSRGDLAPGLDAAEVAAEYEVGGAACLSVLTDSDWFGGSGADLEAARSAVAVPVLRKDFTVGARDVCDARLMGADAVLLIVAALDDAELAELHSLALVLGFDALVEVHDEAELDRALAVGATLIGVNQRDLVTFTVDGARAARVGAAMPPGVVRIAESGIRDAADAVGLAAAGFHGVLVGESVVTAGDRAAAVTALRVPRQ